MDNNDGRIPTLLSLYIITKITNYEINNYTKITNSKTTSSNQ